MKTYGFEVIKDPNEQYDFIIIQEHAGKYAQIRLHTDEIKIMAKILLEMIGE